MKKVISFILSLSVIACSTAMLSAAESINILGDINSDGKVDLTDLSELSLAIIGDKTLTDSQIKAADINKNGEADLTDLARMRQYLSKVVDSLETNKNESVPAEQPSQPVSSVYSVTFKDYDELSEKFENTLEELITEMNEKYDDTTVIENYKKNIHSKHSVSVPFSDGKKLQLRNKEGFSNIAFFTRELYSKPCFFFRFEDGITNSYIRIYDISDELRSMGSVSAYEFMKIKNPDSSHTYDQKTVHMEDRDIEVAFRKLDNDPRIHAYFIYDDSLVMLCCSEAKIDSGFLESLSIEDLPLKSSEQISAPEPVYDFNIIMENTEEYAAMRENISNLSDEEFYEYSSSVRGGSSPDRKMLSEFDKLMSSLPVPVIKNAEITYVSHESGVSADTNKRYDIAYISFNLSDNEWVRLEYLFSVENPEEYIDKPGSNPDWNGIKYDIPKKISVGEVIGESYNKENNIITWYIVSEGRIIRAVYKSEYAGSFDISNVEEYVRIGTINNYMP